MLFSRVKVRVMIIIIVWLVSGFSVFIYVFALLSVVVVTLPMKNIMHTHTGWPIELILAMPHRTQFIIVTNSIIVKNFVKRLLRAYSAPL